MPYTVRIKTTKTNEKPETINAFKAAIEIDMRPNYNKASGMITFAPTGQDFTYIVDEVDRGKQFIFATVDDQDLAAGF